MIENQETDLGLCGDDSRACNTDSRKSSQIFTGDSPKLKKARHNWQVKNNPLTVVDDGIHSQLTITINGVQQPEGIQESAHGSDSIQPCGSHSALNDRVKYTTCSHDERDDIAKSNGDLHVLCLDGYNRCETAEINPAIDTSDDQNTINSNGVKATSDTLNNTQPNGDDDSCKLDFSYALEDSDGSDSSVIILVPQRNADSTDYPSAQNLVSRSVDPNDPLRYIAMPTGRWLLECSLMRAELDNDINKTLERLRYYADQQGAQWTQRASYISKRLSLESAGIFQVIEEQGLRTTCTPNSSTLRPYCKDHTSAVENMASSSTSACTQSLHDHIVESNEENGLDVTMSDLCSTRNEPASCNASLTGSLQSNPPELCRSSELTTINELSSTPSSSFIIDQAVSAVIVERGIHL